MPRESRPRVTIASAAACSCPVRSASARSGDRSASVCANRRLTASATRCCWAPSWMSRSSRRRSVSWASTSRCREERSSSARADSSAARCSSSTRRLAPRSTSPACAARPEKRRSSTEVSGTCACSCTTRSPSSSPPWRTSSGPDGRRGTRVESLGARRGRLAWPRGGQGRPVIHDQPHLRPLRTRAFGEHPGHLLGQVLSGVPSGHSPGEPTQHVERRRRPPCTTREANLSRRACTRSNARATTAVATTERATSAEEVRPSNSPPPTTRTA